MSRRWLHPLSIMGPQTPYFLSKLREVWFNRQRRNPGYSLRAFARYLNLQPSTLSAVLAAKRGLPKNAAEQVAHKLGLSPVERQMFLNSVQANRQVLRGLPATAPVLDAHLLEEQGHYQVIAEWEHYAILSLMDTDGFHPAPASIATRLGVSVSRAEDCLRRLQATGLVRQDIHGRLIKTYLQVKTTEDIHSAALRQSHHEALEMGVEKLEQLPVHERDFSSITIAMQPHKMPQAKALIRRFRAEFTELMETGGGSEVFQLSLQFYPLTVNSQGVQNEQCI